jgi:hypothetical protein
VTAHDIGTILDRQDIDALVAGLETVQEVFR